MTATVFFVYLDTEKLVIRNSELIKSNHILHLVVALDTRSVVFGEQSLLVNLLGCRQLRSLTVNDIIPDIVYVVRKTALVLNLKSEKQQIIVDMQVIE